MAYYPPQRPPIGGSGPFIPPSPVPPTRMPPIAAPPPGSTGDMSATNGMQVEALGGPAMKPPIGQNPGPMKPPPGPLGPPVQRPPVAPGAPPAPPPQGQLHPGTPGGDDPEYLFGLQRAQNARQQQAQHKTFQQMAAEKRARPPIGQNPGPMRPPPGPLGPPIQRPPIAPVPQLPLLPQ